MQRRHRAATPFRAKASTGIISVAAQVLFHIPATSRAALSPVCVYGASQQPRLKQTRATAWAGGTAALCEPREPSPNWDRRRCCNTELGNHHALRTGEPAMVGRTSPCRIMPGGVGRLLLCAPLCGAKRINVFLPGGDGFMDKAAAGAFVGALSQQW